MVKELTAEEAKEQAEKNLHKNVVFQAIDSESKLGNFEVTIPKEHVNDAMLNYLHKKGYVTSSRESRGKNFIKRYVRVSWS